jgi:hypothetical protein
VHKKGYQRHDVSQQYTLTRELYALTKGGVKGIFTKVDTPQTHQNYAGWMVRCLRPQAFQIRMKALRGEGYPDMADSSVLVQASLAESDESVDRIQNLNTIRARGFVAQRPVLLPAALAVKALPADVRRPTASAVDAAVDTAAAAGGEVVAETGEPKEERGTSMQETFVPPTEAVVVGVSPTAVAGRGGSSRERGPPRVRSLGQGVWG